MSAIEIAPEKIDHLDFEEEVAHMWWYDPTTKSTSFNALCGASYENCGHPPECKNKLFWIPFDAKVCPQCKRPLCSICICESMLKEVK